MKRAFTIGLAATLLALLLTGRESIFSNSAPPKEEITATFSIAAVDPETGMCGAAVASRANAACLTVAHARPGVGVFCTQHYAVKSWGTKALDALADKKIPEEVLAELLKNDKAPEGRQLAIIDMKGRSSQRHPVGTSPSGSYWGGMSGRFYVCQGNTLSGRDVIVAMAKAYEETRGSFADRLMAALIAGDCAGGDHRGRLSAGIRVCKKDGEGYWLDMHVEKNADAVVVLHKQYVESTHEARGDWGKQPYQHPCPNRPALKKPG